VSKKKPYSLINVKNVPIAALKDEGVGRDLSVGIDIAKDTLKVGLWWSDGRFSQPWEVRYPEQLPLLIEHLGSLARERKLIVVMEPTGSYGDPLRWALGRVGLTMHRMQTKASHDYCEVFDGVPSNHDAKDAVMLAKLGHQGDSRPWPLEAGDELAARRRAWVSDAEDLQAILGVWTNRLEALLARHWPEAGRILNLKSATLTQALMEYGTPAALAGDAQAAAKLQRWGGPLLEAEKVTRLIASARQTAGVPANELEAMRLRHCAAKVRETDEQLSQVHAEMARSIKGEGLLEMIAQAVGAATACLLFVRLGDPRKYCCARAYLKAAGLNLAERSSGRYQGQLKITKRGPAAVRKWLYLAACRRVSSGPGAAWFAAHKARSGGRKGSGGRALVALMRKLLTAVWSMARSGEMFDAHRLFGVAASAGASRQRGRCDASGGGELARTGR
jgi:transposase